MHSPVESGLFPGESEMAALMRRAGARPCLTAPRHGAADLVVDDNEDAAAMLADFLTGLEQFVRVPQRRRTSLSE